MASGDVRASDAERDRTARELREHFAAGRLLEDEFDERVQQAYGAATVGDLQALTADLPALPASPAEARAQLVAQRGRLQRRLVQETGGAIVAFVACVAIWLASGAHGSFWPIWVALAVVIPLVRGGWQLYGPGADLDRVERELDERSARRLESRSGRRARHR